MTNCIGSVMAHLAEKWINQKLKPHNSLFGGAGNIRSRAQDGRAAAALLVDGDDALHRSGSAYAAHAPRATHSPPLSRERPAVDSRC